MNFLLRNAFFVILTSFSSCCFGQNINLFQQYSGRIDFTFIGNALNPSENSFMDEPVILTSSNAILDLAPSDLVKKAFLYWSGCGPGDFNVALNGVAIASEKNYSLLQSDLNKPFFSGFADVTELVQATGNGTYLLSNLDLTDVIDDYFGNKTNFGGWAMIIIYENATLPKNQINIYDGLQAIPREPNSSLNIVLNSLNVSDNIGSKIGFIAWEGDKNIEVLESLKLNDVLLSSPPLNPENNAFNGTNSITNSDSYFNMDLDIYNTQNIINVGDLTARIDLTSGQDFVMINVVATKFNSVLPDATITFNNVQQSCNSRQITVDYIVKNLNSTNNLPANTPIAFYANNILIGTASTTSIIPIDGSLSGQIILNIPTNIPVNFVLKFVVDDVGTGTGIVPETIEINNAFSQNFAFYVIPKFNILPNKYICQDVIANAIFDFSNYAIAVKIVSTDVVQFFETYENALNNIAPIDNISNYLVNVPSKTIFVRLQNSTCFSITQFTLNLVLFPKFNVLDDLFVCKQTASSSFDFSSYLNAVKVNSNDTVKFFNSQADAENNVNSIININNFIPTTSPKTIYVSIDDLFCYSITSFKLIYYDLPKFKTLANIESCNKGLTSGFFDFSNYFDSAKVNPADNVSFFTSQIDAINNNNSIFNPSNYFSDSTPKEIFVRIENGNFCYDTTSFKLTTIRCPIKIFNAVSMNGDGKNDYFFIEGLRDVFLDHELLIYNRWGQLVWKGNNNIDDFRGYSNVGLHLDNQLLSEGTYFYVLTLNDLDYPKPYNGYLYLSK